MKLSLEIKGILEHDKLSSVSLSQILHEIGDKSFGLLLILLTMISALPVPAAGYSTPFGIIIVLISAQMFLNNTYPYLPKKILDKKRNFLKIKKSGKRIVKYISFFEKFIKPRFLWVNKKPFKYSYIILIFLCGLSMIMPIPGTNTIPSLSILIMALGMSDDDGFFIILGMLSALFSFVVTYFIFTIGINIASVMIDYVLMLF